MLQWPPERKALEVLKSRRPGTQLGGLWHVVFILTRADAVGGASVHVRDLAVWLEQRGIRATVLIGGTGEVLDLFEAHGVAYRSIGSLGRAIHPVKDSVAVVQLVRALRELRPDLVCAHTSKAGVLGRLAGAAIGVPVLYTPHGLTVGGRVSKRGSALFGMIERTVAPLGDKIITVCEAERKLAQDWRIASSGKLAVIRNGVQDVGTHLRARTEVDPPRVIMVARFAPPKDHETLLRAMALLAGYDWHLELAGNGPKLDDAQRLAGQLGLAGRVDFVTGAPIEERLAQAQLFVLTTRSEALPLSILEAMRAGLPVVASDVGGVSEGVADGRTGFLVKAGDPEALAAAIALLVRDPALRSKLGSAGRACYEDHFTAQRMCETTLALYKSVLAARQYRLLVQQESQ